MKALQDLKNELDTMRFNYQANPLPIGKAYNKFAKKFKSKQAQIKSYNSIANQLKRASIKVTKTSIGYRFNGKKVVADVYLSGCETGYWTFNADYLNRVDLDTQFRTKSDVLQYLLSLELNDF